MRKVFTLLFVLAIFLCSNSVFAQDTDKPANQVVAYYFHGNFRCVNCYNMEKWAKEVVEAEFKDELTSGKLAFRVINTDTNGNEHFMADYKLYTKSVVLALVEAGKEMRYDNLTKVWDYLRNEEAFKKYIKSEIEKYLKEL